jgi:RNA polymerase sigma-70 factor (ECF subfamily)
MSREDAIRVVSELFDTWYVVVLRYAERLTGDSGAAEDVVQESFMELFRQLTAGKRIDNLKAWTFTVVRRSVFHRVRHLGGREVPLEGSELLDFAVTPAHGGGTDFERLMRLLSRREEEVVRLRLESLTYREIGRRLGITASSVNTLLARALRKLRSHLDLGPEQPSHAEKERSYNAFKALQ